MPTDQAKSVTTTMRFDEDELAFLTQRSKMMHPRSVTGLMHVYLRVSLGILTKEKFRTRQFEAHLVQAARE